MVDRIPLVALDALALDVITNDVSDNYVSKTLFTVSEFANVVRAGATALSGEALLCAHLGIALRQVECIAVSHRHWDHMAALPAVLHAIRAQCGKATVHVNPGMHPQRRRAADRTAPLPAAGAGVEPR